MASCFLSSFYLFKLETVSSDCFFCTILTQKICRKKSNGKCVKKWFFHAIDTYLGEFDKGSLVKTGWKSISSLFAFCCSDTNESNGTETFVSIKITEKSILSSIKRRIFFHPLHYVILGWNREKMGWCNMNCTVFFFHFFEKTILLRSIVRIVLRT